MSPENTLRTLKDLEYDMGGEYSITIVESENLRKEAIKWIKKDIKDYKNADLHLPAPPVGINIHNFIVSSR